MAPKAQKRLDVAGEGGVLAVKVSGSVELERHVLIHKSKMFGKRILNPIVTK